MTSERNPIDPKAYNPRFTWRFLAPKYWTTWCGLFGSIGLALLPLSIHQTLAKTIAKRLVKSKSNSVNNIRTNLAHCFPEKSLTERETLIEKTLYTAGVFTLRFPLLKLRSATWLQQRCDVKNGQHLDNLLSKGQNAVLLVPHSWAIDIPAVLFASKGYPVSAMAKRQKNEVVDWIMHNQRVQYGGRVYERSGGIKPFIKSIKEGYLGYYLPDQDHGPELSEFVDFFAATKATLPGLSKIAKLTKAKIIPTFASFNPDSGRFCIELTPPLTEQSEDTADAQAMNSAIEYFVEQQPEQYMWTLRFLRTQSDHRNLYREMRNQHPQKIK